MSGRPFGRRLPPGPVLTTPEWLALEQNQPACLHELAARFGPMFTVHAPGRKPRVHVAEPDAISLFSRHADRLRVNGPTLFRPLVGERSLTFLNGAEHRAARRLTARALHCDDPDALASRIARIARAEVAALPGPPGLPLETFANRATRRVILALTFGELPPDEARALLDALDTAMASLHAKHTVLLTQRHAELGEDFTAARNDLHRLLHHHLQRRRLLHPRSPSPHLANPTPAPDHAPTLCTDHGPGTSAGGGPGVCTAHSPEARTGHNPDVSAGHDPSTCTGQHSGACASHGQGACAGRDDNPGARTGRGPGTTAGHGPGVCTGHGPEGCVGRGPGVRDGGGGTILGRLAGDLSLSEDDVVTHLVTLLVGGHETTSAALSWALRCVSVTPGAGARIRGEVAGGDDRLLELPYLKAACMEALRHSPPLPNGITREVTAEFTAAGHTFPAGTQLVPCISVIHHRPEVYPEPERFVPERFLRRRPVPGHHLPFGAGPRYCPGAALAFRELMVVIAVTVGDPRVRITVPDGDRPRSMGPTTRIPLTATIHRLPP